MTKTFTPTNFKDLSKSSPRCDDKSSQKFYDSIKPKLDELFRDPSDETLQNILNHANSKRLPKK
jgi:hypothetical protein